MSYRSRGYSQASDNYDRYQRYDAPDHVSSNRYRGDHPRDTPEEYNYYESDRLYSSRSGHVVDDIQYVEYIPAYVRRVYYYYDSSDDDDNDEPYYSDRDHHYKDARSSTTKTTRGTRNERDILALPSSLQTVAKQVDHEFGRLEKEAERLEKEKACHQYDVKQYEETKQRIASEWKKYLQRHDEICKEKTRIEGSHKSTRRSTQDTHTSQGPSRHGSTKYSKYDESRSKAASSRDTIRPAEDSKTRGREESNTNRQEDSRTRVPKDSQNTARRGQSSAHENPVPEESRTRTRQSSTKDDRSRQSTTYKDESRAKTERSHKDGPSERTRHSEGQSSHHDDKTQSSSRPREETRGSKRDGERRKDKPRGETLADIIEEVAMPDHYGTLGISMQATAFEIKKAAKEKRILSHPDKFKKSGMSSRELKKIDEWASAVGQAADVLTDPEQKRVYDRAWRLR